MQKRRARRRTVKTPYYIRAGKQTMIDSHVVDFASRFPGKRLKDIHSLVMALSNLKRKKVALAQMDQYYSKRTASQILQDGFVIIDRCVDSYRGEPMAEDRLPVQGCVDYHVALCAVLRAKGIQARFVRKGNHSIVHFFLYGRWYEADVNRGVSLRKAIAFRSRHRSATIEIREPIRRLESDEIKKHKQDGNYKHGLDAWDIGIKSIRDYDRYNK
ncbi:MAG: transglutaminase domain-containing protein [Candidatus Diapherotrites archaeon]|nr:transglutaminase domain-containing protein [Candidatus Diapherotrites archaeon]